MNKNIISIVLIFLFSNVLLSQSKEEPIVLVTETGDIQGTLLVADSTKITPIVLIIAGSGPTDRNGNNPMMTNNSLKMLGEGLAENGIASLRFDKRGIAESKNAVEKESDLRFETYINALLLDRFLKRLQVMKLILQQAQMVCYKLFYLDLEDCD